MVLGNHSTPGIDDSGRVFNIKVIFAQHESIECTNGP